MDWFCDPHGWGDRTAAFAAGAADLFRRAAGTAVCQAGLQADRVDLIVTVCSTGIVTPTPEALVARDMGFRADVMRVPVFCGGDAGRRLGIELVAPDKSGLSGFLGGQHDHRPNGGRGSELQATPLVFEA